MSFVIVIALGTFLLSLPVASKHGRLDVLDAMFTATSAKMCIRDRLRIGRTDEQLIVEMANIFEVSKQAMQIRLKSRNLI